MYFRTCTLLKFITNDLKEYVIILINERFSELYVNCYSVSTLPRALLYKTNIIYYHRGSHRHTHSLSMLL